MTVGKFVRSSSVRPKYGKFLSRFAKLLNPSSIIELGTGAGFSTIFMAFACPGSRVFSIEGCPEIADLAGNNLARIGITNAEVITGSFSRELPGVLNRIRHPLLVFIDGDHRGERLLEYLRIIRPQTDENTVIILDDIRWSASMEKVWKEIISQNEVSASIDLFRMGIIFFRKDINKRHFKIRL
jgi:predicted O-methyltransferase YrrM